MIVARHVDDLADEQQRFFVNVGIALFVAGALYLLYLGLEPFVRRSWPTMLVSWSRLLGGRVRDPLIGRDILMGAAAGASLALLSLTFDLLPLKFGLPEPTPNLTDLAALLGARGLAGTWLSSMNTGLQNAIITVFEFAVLRALFDWVTHSGVRWSSRRWAWTGRLSMSDTTSERVFVVLCILTVTGTSLAGSGPLPQRLIAAGYQAISTLAILIVLLRIGIFAAAIMFFVTFLLLRVPLTLDGTALYATEAWITIAGVIALAAAGFWMARAGVRPRHAA